MAQKYDTNRSAAGEATACLEYPIQATITRATTRFADLGMSFGPLPKNWWRASDVVADPAAVSDLLDQVCQIYETDDRQVAASFLVLGYFWYPMVGALACYLLERRVPDLAASAVAMRLHGGVTFLSPHCWVLPDDPAAGHPDVTTMPSLGDLRAHLIKQLQEQHATPLFATLRSVAPYGITAMRANYVDRLASAVLWLAELLGDDEIARREVPALVALASPKSRTGIIEIEHEGRSRLFLQRGGCCLIYRLPAGEMCTTCRLRPADERAAMLRDDMSHEAPFS